MKITLATLAISALLITITTSDALAKKKSDPPPPDNLALILGQAGESYPISGTGGIKVRGGHFGYWSSNVKTSRIEIDGSGISAQKLAPNNVTSDFTALPLSAYFVSQSAVCTLTTAAGAAGEEIVVCNAGKDVVITYQTLSGETLTVSGEQAGVQVVNKTPGKVDRFISDGKSWYRE